MELLGLIENIDLQVELDSKTRIKQLQGEILALLGRFEDAKVVFVEAKEGAKKLKNISIKAEVLSAQADISLKQGNLDDALSMHNEALKNFIELGDAQGAARCYNNMGYLLRRKNDRSKALESYGEVETILEQNDDVELISAQLILARSFLDLGEVERASMLWMHLRDQTILKISKYMLVPKQFWEDIMLKSEILMLHHTITVMR